MNLWKKCALAFSSITIALSMAALADGDALYTNYKNALNRAGDFEEYSMLANTTTPDGYAVGADGKWIAASFLLSPEVVSHIGMTYQQASALYGSDVDYASMRFAWLKIPGKGYALRYAPSSASHIENSAECFGASGSLDSIVENVTGNVSLDELAAKIELPDPYVVVSREASSYTAPQGDDYPCIILHTSGGKYSEWRMNFEGYYGNKNAIPANMEIDLTCQ